MASDPHQQLAEPFARLFADRAEAEWAMAWLLDTAKRLGINGPYDHRFALTLAQRGGRLGLHLNFGGWLVLGFQTGQRVELPLLAGRVTWDERLASLPFERKEGEPEVRSYHLPLALVRPMSAALSAAYEATLDFIALKFQHWQRAIPWKQHRPELVEALFDLDKRTQLLTAGLDDPELLYDRQLTAFYHDVSEEPEVYEVGEGSGGAGERPFQEAPRGSGGAEERGSGGAGERGSGGAGEQGSRGAGERRSGGAEEISFDTTGIEEFDVSFEQESGISSQDKKTLAAPFSQIFADREEAEWAFDFLRATCKKLGIKGPDDQRFALTLRHGKNIIQKRMLRLNFGNWAILSFYNPSHLPYRIHLNLLVDQVRMPENSYKKWSGFAQEDDEPEISAYNVPIEVAKSLHGDLRTNFETTLAYTAERFQNWQRCVWRKQNIPKIAEAVFDLKKRDQLLTQGLSLDIPSAEDELDIFEVVENRKLNPPYPLAELAGATGFEEAELARWVRAIERKGQAILYGPPGTGKTFMAEQLARHLIGGGDGFYELVQFHPAYAYEDFIQGIRPESDGDRLAYPLQPGRFLEFCQKAQTRRQTCVLIIDEINRANLARVFGELMYLLEYRRQSIPLAGGGRFHIPANVRLIGTMNTADRSIALVDHALRRRFAFIKLEPKYDLLRRFHRESGFPVEGLISVLRRLNQVIQDEYYFVGVTFFLREALVEEIEDIWRMEIEPYLEEYFFDQPGQVDAFRWDNIKREMLPS